jgi:hypothetical protein
MFFYLQSIASQQKITLKRVKPAGFPIFNYNYNYPQIFKFYKSYELVFKIALKNGGKSVRMLAQDRG